MDWPETHHLLGRASQNCPTGFAARHQALQQAHRLEKLETQWLIAQTDPATSAATVVLQQDPLSGSWWPFPEHLLSLARSHGKLAEAVHGHVRPRKYSSTAANR